MHAAGPADGGDATDALDAADAVDAAVAAAATRRAHARRGGAHGGVPVHHALPCADRVSVVRRAALPRRPLRRRTASPLRRWPPRRRVGSGRRRRGHCHAAGLCIDRLRRAWEALGARRRDGFGRRGGARARLLQRIWRSPARQPPLLGAMMGPLDVVFATLYADSFGRKHSGLDPGSRQHALIHCHRRVARRLRSGARPLRLLRAAARLARGVAAVGRGWPCAVAAAPRGRASSPCACIARRGAWSVDAWACPAVWTGRT